ncbi:hypothetical protein, partial [Candidatus Cardinium hertigii]|uniref:hypothetical protein n=1 Tax=Candidatus Cardinium hertigii TaxID=247481 RepID=UPI003F6A550C
LRYSPLLSKTFLLLEVVNLSRLAIELVKIQLQPSLLLLKCPVSFICSILLCLMVVSTSW